MEYGRKIGVLSTSAYPTDPLDNSARSKALLDWQQLRTFLKGNEMKDKKKTGKKIDPDFSQVTAYIPTTLHLDVKRKLIGMEDDFSTTVEKLLKEWLKRK